ncbi:LacI family DNA-binding transcriptional regulator [Denitrobaculum tricleocarpae]|uniref:LacI family transcriptional regulator n=1 Tax=Denitrobaculum tricleocarpae TaxID=2591009 RepID=A0A545SZA4_9PROT|nr:LacI family DNA-binding transcriptional regulator [Denitrobaculum tricleocarpae]TQV70305.1 LacI family transcriptional regulator [Denitrobaculum tricleocarpae]
MAVTLKEVAERAGVSRSAVSRTFTQGASVSAKTRKKVEKAARDLGYSPSLIARSLATNRTKLIGLIANNFQNPVFLEVFDLYTRALQERNLRPLLVNLTDQTDPSASVQLLKQYSVDGVIVASSTLPPLFAHAFKEAQVPVVHAFGRFASTPDIHIVGIDNEHCGALAAETLQKHRYKRVAFLGGPQSATSAQDRAAGFTRRAKEIGLEIVSSLYADAYAYNSGQQAMRELLNDRRFEAVFCGDDLICMGAMDAARDAGLSIPQDVGFIGFNDMNMAAWQAYSLTTIRQPTSEIILSSVDLVVSMLDTPERAPEVRLFPCSVVERGTLKPIEG